MEEFLPHKPRLALETFDRFPPKGEAWGREGRAVDTGLHELPFRRINCGRIEVSERVLAR